MSKLRLRWFSALLLLGLSVFVLSSCGKTTDTNTKVRGPYYICNIGASHNSNFLGYVVLDCGANEQDNPDFHTGMYVMHERLWQQWKLVYQNDQSFKMQSCYITKNNTEGNFLQANSTEDAVIMAKNSSDKTQLWRFESVSGTEHKNEFMIVNNNNKVLQAVPKTGTITLFDIKLVPYPTSSTPNIESYHFKLYSPPVEVTP